jgi:hypothetical protein
LVLNAYAQAAVVYVDRDNQSGNEDGLSWETAFTEIQDGINISSPGDEVWVAEGIYDETRTLLLYDPPTDTGSLMIGSNVSLYGGFVGTENVRADRDWSINATVIEGAVSRDGLPAYHVVFCAEDVRIDGFTVRGGRSDDPPLILLGTGAGIRSISDGLIIDNCLITDNVGNGTGGVSTFGSIEIRNSIIEYNVNGGVYADTSAMIVDCEFRSNSDDGKGAAIFASPDLAIPCLFKTAYSRGMTRDQTVERYTDRATISRLSAACLGIIRQDEVAHCICLAILWWSGIAYSGGTWRGLGARCMRRDLRIRSRELNSRSCKLSIQRFLEIWEALFIRTMGT